MHSCRCAQSGGARRHDSHDGRTRQAPLEKSMLSAEMPEQSRQIVWGSAAAVGGSSIRPRYGATQWQPTRAILAARLWILTPPIGANSSCEFWVWGETVQWSESRQNFHRSTGSPSCLPTCHMFFKNQILRRPWRQLTGACLRSRISVKILSNGCRIAMAAPWKPGFAIKVHTWLPNLDGSVGMNKHFSVQNVSLKI